MNREYFLITYAASNIYDDRIRKKTDSHSHCYPYLRYPYIDICSITDIEL